LRSLMSVTMPPSAITFPSRSNIGNLCTMLVWICRRDGATLPRTRCRPAASASASFA
jgi:hypothetical protein